ncbi:MAG: UDP-N-acetylmuramoyl-tripeptide--D-alanyl-D-alanine ligase [Nannocystaceae bacterium]|nr:UDP-N-acetylmuramoyl-tripeptide--D-alanyl-D-alanine ligase [Nannocystaceae bacterium]
MQWTPEALARAAGGTLIRSTDRPVRGVFIDSRSPQAGGLFVPIMAARDGHEFISAAVRGGAAATLVQRGHAMPDGAVSVIEVEDTQEALTRLATARCAAFEGPVVTISGSNGKTTTRAMIAGVLDASLQTVLCTRGNLNNHLGVPLTVLGEPHAPDAMVVELGMSAPGENAALAAVAQPQIHVITSVALEHLEFMKSIEAIAAAEAEPVAYVRPGGCVVAPGDEELLRPHLAGAGVDVMTFGHTEDCDVQILDVSVDARTRASVRVGPHAPVELDLPLFGAHNARNAAAALAVGHRLGLSLEASVQALASVRPVGDRGRAIEWGEHLLIADCYNANPGSVEVALRSLAQLDCPGPKIAVLGDMLELGPTQDQLHADAGALAARLGVDAVFGFGPLTRHTVDAAQRGGVRAEHFDSIEALADAIRKTLEGADAGAALLKGSRGMKLERTLAALGPESLRPPVREG